MVLASAAVHVVAVALAVVLPYSLRDDSPKAVSYTVDLIAPDRLGGTNIPGRAKPRPQAKAAPAPPPPPAAVSQPVAPPKPPEPVKKEPPPQPAKKEPPPEPVKKEAPPPKPVAKPKEPAKKPPVKVSAKKAEQPKPVPAKESKPEAKKAAAEKPKAAPPKEEAKPQQSLQEQREAIAARLRDERLAAAVQRAQNRVEDEATGNGAGDGSGPASYGPGEGAGGVLKGLDWIMYKNRVETMIRENWAWTGSDRALEATVSFGITEAGEIVNFQVEKSSGDLTYDASIERAIKAVSPLPPPPEAYREEFSQYELTFNAEFLQM